MEDRLETTYDVIVVGTGVTEAVAAAALARSGKKVLHIDSLPYYGEVYCSVSSVLCSPHAITTNMPARPSISFSPLTLSVFLSAALLDTLSARVPQLAVQAKLRW
jgi:RAB protein geranylgeranyltransferase component A